MDIPGNYDKYGTEDEAHTHEMTLRITGLAQNELIQRVGMLEERLGERLDALEERLCIDIVRSTPSKYPRRLLWPFAAFLCGMTGLSGIGGVIAASAANAANQKIPVNLQQAGLDHSHHDSRGVGTGRSPPQCIACVYAQPTRIFPEPIP